jgi:polyisoprenyl-teichoic acid--peptidoglycan teichoic acid transferase
VREFMHPPAQVARKSARRIRRAGAARARDTGVVDRLAEGKALARAAPWRNATRMPVVVPGKLTAEGTYPASEPDSPNPRRYVLEDEDGNRHAAYRLVVAEDVAAGQYYGIQGTTWKSPPILDDPSERRRMGRRTYELFYDGGRLRIVAWRTSRGVYWISNTLLRTLRNRQMLALARSARRIGER